MDLRSVILETLPNELWLDLEDGHRANAFEAHHVVKTNLTLNAKRSREVEGQIRFRLQEQGFEEIVLLHGGSLLQGGIIPGSDLRTHQPFVRFQGPNVGVVLGFAAMPEARKMPPKNKSRAAGITLNHHLQPSLFDDPESLRSDDPNNPNAPKGGNAAVKLRKIRTPFLPPENLPDNDAETGVHK